MSKCWYCNNELTTGDSPKHFGICNKCYDGMFKSGDAIIRSFTNKISDLEAKLAEKDAERELDNSFWKQECDSLQKALAEKEQELEQVTSKLQASYEKDPLLKKGSKVIYDGAIWRIASHKQNKQLGLVEVKLKFEKNIGYDNKAKIIFCDDIVDTSNKELKGKVEDER